MCENLHYESVYFKELHNQQEHHWPTIYRTGAAVVSTITSYYHYYHYHYHNYYYYYIIIFIIIMEMGNVTSIIILSQLIAKLGF